MQHDPIEVQLLSLLILVLVNDVNCNCIMRDLFYMIKWLIDRMIVGDVHSSRQYNQQITVYLIMFYLEVGGGVGCWGASLSSVISNILYMHM